MDIQENYKEEIYEKQTTAASECSSPRRQIIEIEECIKSETKKTLPLTTLNLQGFQEQDPSSVPPAKPKRKFLGLFLGFLGCLAFLGNTLAIKYVLEEFKSAHPLQILLLGGYLFLGISFPGALIKKAKITGFTKNETKFMCFRIGTLVTIFVGIPFLLDQMPVSLFTLFWSSMALFFPITSKFLLKQPLRLVHILALGVSTIGMILILQLDFIFGTSSTDSGTRLYIAILVLLVLIFMEALELTYVSKLEGSVHVLTSNFYIGLGTLVVAPMCQVLMGVKTYSENFICCLFILLAYGLYYLGITLYYLAFAIENPTVLGFLEYIAVILAFLFDILLFSSSFNALQFLGASFILIACIGISVHKIIKEKKVK